MSTPTTTNGAMSPFASRQFDLFTLASKLSTSDLVPAAFKGKPANVFLALQMAERMELDTFAVMSNLFVVHGTPAFSSKFLIGLANMRGPFKGPLRFRVTGEGTPQLAVTCYATLREIPEDVSVTVTLAQAVTAGWTKNGKYREVPTQMLSYRAAAFLVRLYCPEVALMGARTVDEVDDMHASGALEPRDAEIVRNDPLSRELQTNTATGAAPREQVMAEGETGGAAPQAGPPTTPESAHAKAIAAFVALGVPASVIEAEIAHESADLGDDDSSVTTRLRALHKTAKAEGARALITLLRSDRAADMLDAHLGADPTPAATALFGDMEATHED
jgi:hypothetical protein